MPDDFKMQPDELRELHAHAAAVGERDVHLGRLLTLMVHHLGHAHGLDMAQMNKEAASAEQEAPVVPVTKGKGK